MEQLQAGAMIDIIVPVLNRPRNVGPLMESFHANCSATTNLTFVCTAGDTQQIRAVKEAGAWMLLAGWPAGGGDYARKINYGFAHTSGEFILNGADDIEFTRGWEDAALSKMVDGVAVVATNDMANRSVMRGEFGTHNLISRAYIMEEGGTFDNEPGVVMFEGYDHWYVDMELCDRAKQRGRYAFAKRSVVRHRHPIWKTAPMDATYRKGRLKAREDQQLYVSRSPLFTTRKRDSIAP